MASLETPQRIEPARIEEAPEAVSDVVAELSAASARLENALHPKTAEHLAGLVREMNTYYSNLIEGHNTRPRDIRRALQGQFDQDEGRRNFQLEAAAHVRLQEKIEKRAAAGTLPEPASSDFILWLHREFYKDAPDAMLRIGDKGREFRMDPGRFRSKPEHDNAVGRHVPPSSERVCDFMEYFAQRYRFKPLGNAERFKPEAAYLLEEALIRGEFERGEARRITGLPERSARRVLSSLTDAGLLASESERGPVSLRFPDDALETLFPRLYPEAATS